MFTSIILACHLQSCTVVYSMLFYETEEACQLSQANEGIEYTMRNFPDTDYAEFACHKWEGPKKGDEL